jgi:acyl-CoA synthetase (AMP-forming)/AMP-acid ligase II
MSPADGVTELGDDEIGELWVRTPGNARGYYRQPELTAERFTPDGWLRTGDLARRDADGYYYFVGRTDDMIKTSGYRVSPTEIEEVAYASGMVAEAVAFGVADERLGQQVILAVTGAADATTLRKRLEHGLPRYMIPQRIVLLPELPRSANGKFDRGMLRQRLAAV